MSKKADAIEIIRNSELSDEEKLIELLEMGYDLDEVVQLAIGDVLEDESSDSIE